MAKKHSPKKQRRPSKVIFLWAGLMIFAFLLTVPLVVMRHPSFTTGQLLFSSGSQTAGVADVVYGRTADGDIASSSSISLLQILKSIQEDVRALNVNIPTDQKTVALPDAVPRDEQAQLEFIQRQQPPTIDLSVAGSQNLADIDAKVTTDGGLPEITVFLESDNTSVSLSSANLILIDEAGNPLPDLSREAQIFSKGNDAFLLTFPNIDIHPLSELAAEEHIRVSLKGTMKYQARTTSPAQDPPFVTISVQNSRTGQKTPVRIFTNAQ